MNVAELVERLGALQVRLEARDGKLRCHAPRDALTPELDAAIRANKEALLAFLAATPATDAGARPPALLRAPRDAPVPASFVQELIWFFEQLHGDTPVYNNPAAYPFSNRLLDVPKLSAALSEVVRRHEILRTRFVMEGEELRQVIDAASRVDVPVRDFRHLAALPRDERERTLREHLRVECMKPFDLANGPLLRVGLLQLDEHDYVFHVDAHHMIFDAWSSGVFLHELFQIYAALMTGEPHGLPEPDYQYADLAYTQRRRLDAASLAAQEQFWKNKLGDLPPLLELPYDRARPAQQSFAGDALAFDIPPALSRGLVELGAKSGGTLYMTLLAVYTLALSRYSGRTAIPVASPISFRDRPELENIIGPCFNTVVMANRVDPHATWREHLAGVRETALEAFAHQDLPYGRVIAAVNPQRNLSHEAIAQVCFNLKLSETPVERTAGSDDASRADANDVDTSMKEAKGDGIYDLTLNMIKDEGGIHAHIAYRSSLFDRTTIERFVRHYLALCAAIVADPTRRLGDYAMLDAADAAALDALAAGPTATNADDALARLRTHVAATPQAIAIEDGATRLTYAELDARASRFAAWLRTHGAGPERIVALRAARSVDLVVAIVGILKCGAAFLPIDPANPAAHVQRALTAAAPVLVLHDASIAPSDVAAPHRALADALRDSESCVAGSDTDAVDAQAAYVMFTSGSTGLPKGVVVSRGALANYVAAAGAAYGVGADDRFLQFSTVSFDLCIEEIFVTLGSGACLVLYPGERELSAAFFERFVTANAISVASVPTAYWHAWAAVTEGAPAAHGLRRVIVGGEQASTALLQRWRRAWPGVAWFNSYGPTETTVIATCWRQLDAPFDPELRLPVGRAIGGVQVHVCDDALRRVADGVVGELYIGGAGLARGYLGDAHATATRFVPDPFQHAHAGARLYRTGDLARWRNGQLEIVGRSDAQVKIRGYRVEPNELAERIKRVAGVDDAAVVAVADAQGAKHLGAFWTGAEQDPARVRAALVDDLPDYLQPQTLQHLERLPLTPSGKVDAAALARLVDAVPQIALQPLETDTERRLAALWQPLLGAVALGANSRFFDAGGHSLLAIRLVHAIGREFGADVPVLEIFRVPQLRDMAARIDRALAQKRVLLDPGAAFDDEEETELFRI